MITAADIVATLAVSANEAEQRLRDFASVPPQQWFYEVAYCLLTPQSKAASADAAIAQLSAREFYQNGFDPTPILGSPHNYIRFHNVKSRRLLSLRDRWPTIANFLDSTKALSAMDAPHTRNTLATMVDGLGCKEASHALRNIGWRGLGILDRHILRSMADLGVLTNTVSVGTVKKYSVVEWQYLAMAGHLGIDPDVLDLILWKMHTGYIGK